MTDSEFMDQAERVLAAIESGCDRINDAIRQVFLPTGEVSTLVNGLDGPGGLAVRDARLPARAVHHGRWSAGWR